MITGQGFTCPWANQSVDLPIIISLTPKLDLHIADHLAGLVVVVTVDRLIINVGAVGGVVSVSRIPVATIPEVITAAKDDETSVAVIVSPPVTVVVLMPVESA